MLSIFLFKMGVVYIGTLSLKDENGMIHQITEDEISSGLVHPLYGGKGYSTVSDFFADSSDSEKVDLLKVILYDQRYKLHSRKKLECTNGMIRRLDEIDNSAYQFLLKLLGLTEHEFLWDIEIIGDVLDAVFDILKQHGFSACYPFIITNNDETQNYCTMEECTSDLYTNQKCPFEIEKEEMENEVGF